MIYYIEASHPSSWVKCHTESVIIPCDCSGFMNRGKVFDAATAWGANLATQYNHYCTNNHLTTGGVCSYYRQVAKPNKFLFMGLAPTKDAPITIKSYVRAISNVRDRINQLNITDVSIPITFTEYVSSELQCAILERFFFRWDDNELCDLFIYNEPEVEEDATELQEDELIVCT